MNWMNFIGQYDLIYETPPTDWPDGFLLGNGSLGAVYYAPDALRWVVNKVDVMDARASEVKRIIPPDEAARLIRAGANGHVFNREELGAPAPYGAGPKSCCELVMDLGASRGGGWRSALPSIASRLSLYDATLQVNVDKHLYHPRVSSFVRADEDMLVIRVSDVSPVINAVTTICFSRPEDAQLAEPKMSIERDRLLLEMPMPEAHPYVVGMQVIPRASYGKYDEILKRIRAKYHPPRMGTVSMAMQGRMGIVRVSGDFDLILTVATTRDTEDPRREVHRRLDRATAAGYDTLRRTHAEWWSAYWQKSWVELGDKAQEQLFYLSLYALGCTYRKGPMPGILGLAYGPWFQNVQASPWMGGLANDLNIQCPFFPVHALNHSELFDAYLDMCEALLPVSRRVAREKMGVSGADFAAYNILGKILVGLGGSSRHAFMGSYMALMHCLCWRYRRDVKQLSERLYPFLKEILEFYVNLLKKGEDGRYHLWPSYAVELEIMDCGDAVQIMSMLKVCLSTAIEAAELLQTDPDLAAVWRERLEQFPDYPQGVDQQGRKVVVDGAGIPADHHVGQAGCLHPVYPCGEVDESSNPVTLALYSSTLDSVVDKTAETVYAAEQGRFYECAWECFFRAMTALRLGRAEEFWNVYVPMLLKDHAKPNGLMSHDAVRLVDPATSEANLAAIPDRSILDVGEQMPLFEPWCGHPGCSTPNPRAKEMIEPLIEVNGDYLTMITETLLQSHNGVIRVFPAWPKERDAQFSNLMAEGAILVSARHSEGRVVFITLKRKENSAAFRKVKLKSPWTGRVEELELPERDAITITAKGGRPGTEPQTPQAPGQACPRVLVADPRYALWLGRPAAGAEEGQRSEVRGLKTVGQV